MVSEIRTSVGLSLSLSHSFRPPALGEASCFAVHRLKQTYAEAHLVGKRGLLIKPHDCIIVLCSAAWEGTGSLMSGTLCHSEFLSWE